MQYMGRQQYIFYSGMNRGEMVSLLRGVGNLDLYSHWLAVLYKLVVLSWSCRQYEAHKSVSWLLIVERMCLICCAYMCNILLLYLSITLLTKYKVRSKITSVLYTTRYPEQHNQNIWHLELQYRRSKGILLWMRVWRTGVLRRDYLSTCQLKLFYLVLKVDLIHLCTKLSDIRINQYQSFYNVCYQCSYFQC